MVGVKRRTARELRESNLMVGVAQKYTSRKPALSAKFVLVTSDRSDNFSSQRRFPLKLALLPDSHKLKDVGGWGWAPLCETMWKSGKAPE